MILKTYVFTEADVYFEYPIAKPLKEESVQPSKKEIEEYYNKQRTSNHQREAAESLAFIIVGLPLYLYHWQIIKKEKQEEKID